MSKKSLILSLLFPILSIIVTFILGVTVGLGLGITYLAVLFMFGLLFGGIVPVVLITKCEADTSDYFIGKLIICAALAIGIVFTWFVNLDWLIDNFLLLPLLIFVAEIIFALTRKTDLKTKLCLVLSSPVHVYMGFLCSFPWF